MMIELNRAPGNITLQLSGREGEQLLHAIDAIVDPEDNPADPEMLDILKQLWMKLHAVHSH